MVLWLSRSAPGSVSVFSQEKTSCCAQVQSSNSHRQFGNKQRKPPQCCWHCLISWLWNKDGRTSWIGCLACRQQAVHALPMSVLSACMHLLLSDAGADAPCGGQCASSACRQQPVVFVPAEDRNGALEKFSLPSPCVEGGLPLTEGTSTGLPCTCVLAAPVRLVSLGCVLCEALHACMHLPCSCHKQQHYGRPCDTGLSSREE